MEYKILVINPGSTSTKISLFINEKEEFCKRGVLVIDGYDFKGLDSTAARVRLPKKREFKKLLEAIKEINRL